MCPYREVSSFQRLNACKKLFFGKEDVSLLEWCPHTFCTNISIQWQVARLALEILKKLLAKHEISLDDFGNTSHDLGGGVSSLPISPGHSLLVHMFNDSHLLKKVLRHHYVMPFLSEPF